MGFRQFLGNEKRKFKHSSVLVDLPENLCDDIISWGFDYIPSSSLAINPESPTFGREDDTHLTLLYGLDFDDPRILYKWFDHEKPFACKLGKMMIFSTSDFFDVLSISVDCSDLHRLNDKIRNIFDVPLFFPEYIPHVTIAYLRKGFGDEYIDNNTFDGITFDVNHLVFSTRSNEKIKITLGAK